MQTLQGIPSFVDAPTANHCARIRARAVHGGRSCKHPHRAGDAGGRVDGMCTVHGGRQIVTASWDRTARVWSADGRALAVLAGHAKIVRSAEFSHDGQRVITGSDDGTAKIWRSDGNGDIVTLHGHESARAPVTRSTTPASIVFTAPPPSA
jgi:WD40 repeat protein